VWKSVHESTCGEETKLGMTWPCVGSLGMWLGVVGAREHCGESKYDIRY
jgi:hypothetical protein